MKGAIKPLSALVIMGVLSIIVILGVQLYPQWSRYLFRPAEEAAPATTENDQMPETEDQTDPEVTEETPAAADDWERYRNVNEIRIALNSFFNSHGEYPQRLDQLVPDELSILSRDPRTGQHYDYTRSGAGFTLTFSFEVGILTFPPGEHTLTSRGFDLPETLTETPELEDTAVMTVPAEDAEETESDGSDGSEMADEEGLFPELPTEEKADTDGDGLDDERELALKTDPSSADTDADGLSDGTEVDSYGTDPLNADSDGDGFSDGDEIWSGYDPLKDGGRLDDMDSDGLADILEEAGGLDPQDPDIDGDGLADGDELRVFLTDPRNDDTDGDGYDDGREIRDGYAPDGPGAWDEETLQAVAERRDKFGLHEPTGTTLGT